MPSRARQSHICAPAARFGASAVGAACKRQRRLSELATHQSTAVQLTGTHPWHGQVLLAAQALQQHPRPPARLPPLPTWRRVKTGALVRRPQPCRAPIVENILHRSA